MQTIIVQITNNKALKLLQELEDLNLIRLLKKDVSPREEKLSDKFAGKLNLTDKEYNDFQEYISHSRNEWDSNF
jgi:hypothetical protein